MILYIVKSVITLSICLGIYLMLLEREKMHRFNRSYLLIAIILGFAIPLLSFNVYIPSPQLDNQFHGAKEVVQDQIEVPAEYILKSVGTPIVSKLDEGRIRNSKTRQSQIKNAGRGEEILLVIYLLGAGIFAVHFLVGLYKMYRQIREGEKIEYESATLVLLEGNVIPHSFLNYIFVSAQAFNNGEIAEEILTHELTHVEQYHTLDVFFLELIKVVYWFNPAVYFFQKPVKINHEFLADQAVIQTDVDTSHYQQVLLGSVSRVSTSPLASTLTYSLTKKRLMMMVKESSKRVLTLKMLLLLPAIASLVLIISDEERYAQRSVVGEDFFVKTMSAPKNLLYADVTLNRKRIEEERIRNWQTELIYDNQGSLYTGEQNWYIKGTDVLYSRDVYKDGQLSQKIWADKSGTPNAQTTYKNGQVAESVRIDESGIFKRWTTYEDNKLVKSESIGETDTLKTRSITLYNDYDRGYITKGYEVTDEGEVLKYLIQRVDSVDSFTLLQKHYFPEGQLQFESTTYFKLGEGLLPKRHGLQTEYNQQGEIVSQVLSENGKEVKKAE